MDRAERERLRGLCEEATPGPWEFRIWEGGDSGIEPNVTYWSMTDNRDADAEFIAAARTALPELLEALDAAEKERDDYRSPAGRLAWLGLSEEEACESCGGIGRRTYADTSTWRRGGVAGQALTSDVCDRCWGTGSRHQTGANLRAMQGRLAAAEARVKALEAALRRLVSVASEWTPGSYSVGLEPLARAGREALANARVALAAPGSNDGP